LANALTIALPTKYVVRASSTDVASAIDVLGKCTPSLGRQLCIAGRDIDPNAQPSVSGLGAIGRSAGQVILVS
jgi:hypothetical protein